MPISPELPTGRQPGPPAGEGILRWKRKETEKREDGGTGCLRVGAHGGGGARPRVQLRARVAAAPARRGHRRRVLTLGCFLAWVTITRNMATTGAGEGLALYRAPAASYPSSCRGPMSPEAPGAAGARRRGPDVAAPAFACLPSLRRAPPPRPPRRHRRGGLGSSCVSAAPGRAPGSGARGAGTCGDTPAPPRRAWLAGAAETPRAGASAAPPRRAPPRQPCGGHPGRARRVSRGRLLRAAPFACPPLLSPALPALPLLGAFLLQLLGASATQRGRRRRGCPRGAGAPCPELTELLRSGAAACGCPAENPRSPWPLRGKPRCGGLSSPSPGLSGQGVG